MEAVQLVRGSDNDESKLTSSKVEGAEDHGNNGKHKTRASKGIHFLVLSVLKRFSITINCLFIVKDVLIYFYIIYKIRINEG